MCCLIKDCVVCVLGVAAISSVPSPCPLLLKFLNRTMLCQVSPRAAVSRVIYTNQHRCSNKYEKTQKQNGEEHITRVIKGFSRKQNVWMCLFVGESGNLRLQTMSNASLVLIQFLPPQLSGHFRAHEVILLLSKLQTSSAYIQYRLSVFITFLDHSAF